MSGFDSFSWNGLGLRSDYLLYLPYRLPTAYPMYPITHLRPHLFFLLPSFLTLQFTHIYSSSLPSQSASHLSISHTSPTLCDIIRLCDTWNNRIIRSINLGNLSEINFERTWPKLPSTPSPTRPPEPSVQPRYSLRWLHILDSIFNHYAHPSSEVGGRQ